MRFRFVLAALVLLGAAPASAQVRYTVTVDDPATRTYHVLAELPATGGETVVSLPAWTPGHYEIHDYARYLSGFGATDDAGTALDWEKLDKDTWRIASDGASRVVVAFDVLADTVNLSGSLLAEDFGIVNGTNLFVHPETGFDFASTVTFELPDGWDVATGLAEVAPNRFEAADYHTLVDAPAFLGHFGFDSLRVDGVPIRLAVYPAEQIDTEYGRMTLAALGEIAAYLHDFFGGVPYDSYTTLIYLSAEDLGWGGGLEHANSHFDVLPLQAATPRAFPGLYSLYSHEYVHAWNVKRIRPAEMWPYDYAVEQFTPLLWVSEGITDYYGDLVLARTGLWSEEELWRSFAQAAQNVAGEPPTAVEDSSLETWIDPVDVPSQYYYAKGKLLGFLLDVMIRDATGGEASLDDVMRRLHDERYLEGRGFTTDDVLDFVDDHVDPAEVRVFYERYVDGRDDLPMTGIAAKIGLDFAIETAELPFLGVGIQPGEEGEPTVTVVVAQSAAESAGVEEGDVLVSVGGVVVADDPDWGASYRERYAGATGEPLEIVVRRGGEEVTLEGTVRTRERSDVTLEVDPDASERAVELREGLLAR